MRTLLTLSLLLAIALPVGGADAAAPEGDPAPEETASFEFSGTDTRVALREVADRFDILLVIPESLEGTTTIKLRDVTWREAFDAIVSPHGHRFREEGSVVVVERFPDDAEVIDGWPFGGSMFWKVGAGGVLLALAVVVLCHVALSIGVLMDKPHGGARFAPKLVWALFVLWGGVVSLLAYWLIHHSTLRRELND